uniref:Uncharacterized protein n=1 Tax=Pseudomonas phage PaBG TaxID=1335230 RepID=S5VV22_9CAUD
MFSEQGYRGPSLSRAGYDLDVAEFDSLSLAITCAQKLLEVNPVGWDVYDSTTGHKVWTTTVQS